MNNKARYDWPTIRAEYEAGASQSELSRRFGVSRKAIQKRIMAETWTQDITGAVNRLTVAKVAGVVAGSDPQKTAAALDAAADRKAAVIVEHREAWEGFKREICAAVEANDFDRLKCLKIASEAMRNVQECERKAWGIVDTPAPEQRTQAQAVAVNIDLSGMSPRQITEIACAAFEGGTA